MITKEVYKVYELTGNIERMVYASRSLDDAIQRAKFWLRYEPTPQQVNDLKNFFTKQYTQEYTYSVNGRTVKLELART